MFAAGEYVQVWIGDEQWAGERDWVVCRVHCMVGDMVRAYRADGFLWLGVQEYVRPL